MNDFTESVVAAAARSFELADPVVEFGSKLHGKHGELYGIRPLFASRRYIGCDLEAGEGVDRIEDVTMTTFSDGEAGTVVCLHILEHVWDIFAAAREIRRIVRPGGAAIVVCPFFQHLHPYPRDFWRPTDDAMRELFAGFATVIVGRQGYDSMPRAVFAIGFDAEPADFASRYARFKSTLAEVGKVERIGWFKELKYRLGYYVISKKGFRDHMHRLDVHIEVVRAGERLDPKNVETIVLRG